MRTKKKVSVSLSEELLKAIKDNKATLSRSAFIEIGMRDHLLVTKGVLVPLPKEG